MDEKEKKVTASDIMIGNVYEISEDVLHSVYRCVEDASRFETMFSNMGKRLEDISSSLTNHILSRKWIKGAGKGCRIKKAQVDKMAKICHQYSNVCKIMAASMIETTHSFETDKKLSDIVDGLIKNMEEDTKLDED